MVVPTQKEPKVFAVMKEFPAAMEYLGLMDLWGSKENVVMTRTTGPRAKRVIQVQKVNRLREIVAEMWEKRVQRFTITPDYLVIQSKKD